MDYLYKKKTCIALSHQCGVLSANAPLPERKNRIARFFLKHYALADFKYGFHFKRYNESTYTPVIRKKIRELNVSNKEHYTVYLPSFGDENLRKIQRHQMGDFFQTYNKDSFRGKYFSYANRPWRIYL